MTILLDRIEDFFSEAVSRAAHEHGRALDSIALSYVTGVLEDFSHRSMPDRPMAVMLLEMNDAARRVSSLKEVGDSSLVICGLFPDCKMVRTMGVDYYSMLGSSAYGELSSRLTGSSARHVFVELSSKFTDFIDVLDLVRGSMMLSGMDAWSALREWTRTHSEASERVLERLLVRTGK